MKEVKPSFLVYEKEAKFALPFSLYKRYITYNIVYGQMTLFVTLLFKLSINSFSDSLYGPQLNITLSILK